MNRDLFLFLLVKITLPLILGINKLNERCNIIFPYFGCSFLGSIFVINAHPPILLLFNLPENFPADRVLL